jgi:Flp pilus assembly protein protease CpaA
MARAPDVTMWLLYACFAGLLTLVILAAITDVRERRIPNWLNGGVAALYPVYLLLSPVPVAWPGALAVSLLVGLVGLVLFARELVGGGDVKMITAISLWAGVDQFVLFAVVTALTGGIVGLASLWYWRWSPLIHAYLAGLGWAGTGRGGPSVATAGGSEPSAPAGAVAAAPAPTTLPYGIAIAAGGVAVVIELMKL